VAEVVAAEQAACWLASPSLLMLALAAVAAESVASAVLWLVLEPVAAASEVLAPLVQAEASEASDLLA
jgi:hypothetical protein